MKAWNCREYIVIEEMKILFRTPFRDVAEYFITLRGCGELGELHTVKVVTKNVTGNAHRKAKRNE